VHAAIARANASVYASLIAAGRTRQQLYDHVWSTSPTEALDNLCARHNIPLRRDERDVKRNGEWMVVAISEMRISSYSGRNFRSTCLGTSFCGVQVRTTRIPASRSSPRTSVLHLRMRSEMKTYGTHMGPPSPIVSVLTSAA
jgi:hypothetical protein